MRVACIYRQFGAIVNNFQILLVNEEDFLVGELKSIMMMYGIASTIWVQELGKDI
jgi:hypothetical protein